MLPPISRSNSEAFKWSSHLSRGVVIWTVLLLALDLHMVELTFERLVVQVVIFFLFPTMAAIATILQLASICIRFRLVPDMPEPALSLSVIFVYMRFTTVILPVMGILTFISSMTLVLIVKGTPHRLEVE